MNLGALRPKNQNFYVSRYQTAAEITGAIVKAIDESRPAAQILAPTFKNSDKYTACKLIWIFCKNAIPYKREPGTNQTAKTLPRILADAKKNGGDCKHMATTAAALCKALGIPVKLRLISQTAGELQPNHIYAVANVNGQDVIIDAVLKNFDTEARYNYKYDVKI